MPWSGLDTNFIIFNIVINGCINPHYFSNLVMDFKTTNRILIDYNDTFDRYASILFR